MRPGKPSIISGTEGLIALSYHNPLFVANIFADYYDFPFFIQVASEALINGQRVLESELESLRKQQSIDARAYHSTIDELSRTLTRTQKDRDGLETQLTSYTLSFQR